MNDPQLIETVRTLLAMESSTLMQRMTESEPYIPAGATDVSFDILELVAEERENGGKLVALLDRLDADPGPRGVQISANAVQFNAIPALIPALIADKRKLIAAYESAQSAAAKHPAAADIVGQLLTQHRNHLRQLEADLEATAHPGD
jgi:hypothetical protein